jgi:ABC-type phosphate/phosphonate transport system substrate-binding protein
MRIFIIGKLTANSRIRHFIRCHRLAAVLCFMVLAHLFFNIPRVGAEDGSRLRIGFTGSAFQDVTNTDIKAAVSVLIQKVAWKHFGKGESRFYETLPEMAADLKDRNIEVLATPVEEFMELRKHLPIDPLLISSSDNGTEMEMILLVRKESGIRSFRDLRGRSIVMPQRNPRCLGMYMAWLETLVMVEGSKGVNTYFSSVKETRTAANAIMPVFFRQADACIVTRQVFELTAEMNPQINRELAIISRKGKLSQGVIAVDRRLPEERRQRLLQAFLTLHQTPEGQQLLMLFKVRKLVPFVPGYLKGTETLFAEYHRQKNIIAGKH